MALCCSGYVWTVVVSALCAWVVTLLASLLTDSYWGDSSSSILPATRVQDSGPYPGRTSDRLFWFLQVTDIHISIFSNYERARDLREFLEGTVSLIDPALVLVTGDLTHAKFPDEEASLQQEEEWQIYAKAINSSVLDRVPWIDFRGNHDAFDVDAWHHGSNKFRQYAAYGKHQRHFRYVHSTMYGNYSFVIADATPVPGPRRPYNFFGILGKDDLQALENLFTKAKGDNHTFFATHHPSSMITTDHSRFKALLSGVSAHFCGHLHAFGGLFQHIYGRHPQGHLELELLDWMGNRRYRLVAVDHDLVSFVDTSLHQWPLVLITNPKPAQFVIPHTEPLARMAFSSHVRVLVFSPRPIKSILVSLDESQPAPADCVDGGPLYVFPWQPSQYLHGLHRVSVLVVGMDGTKHATSHRFSLDGTVLPMDLLPQAILLPDLRSLFRMLYLFAWLTVLITLVSAVKGYGSLRLQRLMRCKTRWLIMMMIVCHGIGPWYVGEIISGKYGLVTAHGLFVDGYFLPGSMTYFRGAFQLLLVHFPLLLSLAGLTSPRKTWQSVSMIAFIITFGVLCYEQIKVFKTYGAIGVVIAPTSSWALPIYAWTAYLLLC